MDANYNSVPTWDYGALFRAMSPETKVKTFKVDKAKELDALLANDEFQNATHPQVSNNIHYSMMSLMAFPY